MKYEIQIEYQTGNSFGRSDETSVINDISWNDLDVAKENLKRIKNHYKWINSYDYWMDEPLSVPKFLKDFWNGKIYNSNNSISCDVKHYIPLLTDNRKIFKCYAFWCGYFEKLYSGKIIGEENDMEFSV